MLLVKVACGVAALVMASVTAAPEPCDFSELPFQLGDVVGPAFECQSESGYSFVQPSTLPTATQLQAICAKCSALLTKVANAKEDLPKCTLSLDDGSSVTVDALLTGITTQCAGGAASSGAPSSSSLDGDTEKSEPSPIASVIPTIPPTDKPSKTPTSAPTPAPTPAPVLAPSTAKKTVAKSNTISSDSKTSSGSNDKEQETENTQGASRDVPTDPDEPLPTTTTPATKSTTLAPAQNAIKVVTKSPASSTRLGMWALVVSVVACAVTSSLA